jgi:hypothetical protein
VSYVTIVTGFNTSGEDAKLLFSTAWLFKIATHRLLNIVKQTPAPPASDIGWKSLFYKTVYDAIPNRRYSYGAIMRSRCRSVFRQLGYSRESTRIALRVSTSGAYRGLFEAILRWRQPYMPRIYVRSWNVRGGRLYVRGELQAAIPNGYVML